MDLLIINGHDYSRFIKNTGYGWGRSDLDSDKSTRTKDGRLRRDKIGTKRKITYEVMGLTRAELARRDEGLSMTAWGAADKHLQGQYNMEL